MANRFAGGDVYMVLGGLGSQLVLGSFSAWFESFRVFRFLVFLDVGGLGLGGLEGFEISGFVFAF